MAQVFASFGQSPEDGITYPDLFSQYVAAIDDPNAVDGLGVVNPWGAGPTARKTGTEGLLSAVGAAYPAEGSSISGGSAVTYDITGLVGPQGPQGPPGDPGSITTIKQQVFVPYGNTDLDTVLQQIRDTWTNEDTILYASDSTVRWDRPWIPMPIEEGISTWIDSDMDVDGSFRVVAGEDGVFLSVDSGDTWSANPPEEDSFIVASCAASAGKAVVLGDASRANGVIWTTSDYGETWDEVTVSV